MIFLFLFLLVFSDFFDSAIASDNGFIESPHFQNKINIHTIIIRNSSILSKEQQDHISDKWQGEYDLSGLLSLETELVSLITQLYHQQGYQTSRAIFPEQDNLEQGYLVIEVLEGSIEDITITGNTKISQNYILSRIPAAQIIPLNTVQLNNQLEKLQRNSLIKEIDSILEKGSNQQKRILKINIRENSAQTLSFQGNNNAPASTGSEEGVVFYRHSNLLGGAEELILQGTKSQGKKLAYGSFTIPLTAQNTKIRLRGQIESNDIIVRPLADFEFENDVETYGIDLIHPLFENNNHLVDLTLSYDYHKSQSYILGERFEIDSRFPNGIAKYGILRLASSWTYRTDSHLFKITPQLNFGVERSLFYGQLFVDFFQSLSETWSISTNFSAQFSDDILFPQEQCKIGGNGLANGAIRGYARQAFRNDNCLTASIQSSWAFYKNESSQLKLELSPFFQIGSVFKSNGDSLIPEETLASVGLELGVFYGNFFIKGYSAQPLVNVPDEFEEPFGLLGGLIIRY